MTPPLGCAPGENRRIFLKALIFLVVTTALALGLSRLLGRYLVTNSVQGMKADIRGIQNQLGSLQKCVENLGAAQGEVDKKLKHIGGGSKGGCETKEVVPCGKPPEIAGEKIGVHDADVLPDLALESSGGAIVSTPDTEGYTLGIRPSSFLGVPLCYPSNSARAMIQAGTRPGECWAFKGACGTAIIRLLGPAKVQKISLEHISPKISPTGETSSAPREFSVWGLHSSNDGKCFHLGKFTYQNTGKSIQTFTTSQPSKCAFPFIKVKFHNNHGNPDYTCVYRFRVHGTLDRGHQYGLR